LLQNLFDFLRSLISKDFISGLSIFVFGFNLMLFYIRIVEKFNL